MSISVVDQSTDAASTARPTRETPVVIVGGGAAGLTAAGALKRQGVQSVILERGDRVGGSWSARYERLHLHTIRPLSGLAHYPIPRHYPKYIPKDLYAQYLQDYASRFDLDIVLNCPVERVWQESDKESPGWVVESACGTWRCPVVVIATGHWGSPVLPSWPDADDYEGTLIHSSQYKSGGAYRGKRVLVVGTGNSGSEIAADLAEQGAAFVAVAVRGMPAIVPRDFLGTPVQVFAFLMTPLPARLADPIGRFLARLALGDLTRYGLSAPDWLPFSDRRVATIDVGFVRALKRGHIHVRPNVARFTRSGVVYADGREEDFDAVIAATGFDAGLSRLLDTTGLLDERGYPLYPSGQETPYPGLYFMGYTYSLRGHLYEANRASRRLARGVAAYLQRHAYGGTPSMAAVP